MRNIDKKMTGKTCSFQYHDISVVDLFRSTGLSSHTAVLKGLLWNYKSESESENLKSKTASPRSENRVLSSMILIMVKNNCSLMWEQCCLWIK